MICFEKITLQNLIKAFEEIVHYLLIVICHIRQFCQQQKLLIYAENKNKMKIRYHLQ